MVLASRSSWTHKVLIGLVTVMVGCAGSREVTRDDPPPAPEPAPQPTVSQAVAPPEPPAVTPESEPWLGSGDLLPVSEANARARRGAPLRETAYLFIEVEPRTALILVDGVRAGHGQVFQRLRGARWKTIRVEATGHEPIEGGVEVREREVVKVRLRLEPTAGRLTVVTDSFGAEVIMDGKWVGTTPITLPRVPLGVRHLMLRAGSWQWSGDVEVRAGETKLIEMSIQGAAPTPAPVLVTSPPPASQVAPEPAPQTASTPPPPVAPAITAAPEQPQPTTTEPPSPATGRPKCDEVCKRFIQAVSGSESIREPIFNRCLERCRAGDLRFSVCAWKAKDMNDVATCMNLAD